MKNHEELYEHYKWLLETGQVLVNSEDYYKWTKGSDYLVEARKIAQAQGWE